MPEGKMVGGGTVGAEPCGPIVLKESKELAEATMAGSAGIWVWVMTAGPVVRWRHLFQDTDVWLKKLDLYIKAMGHQRSKDETIRFGF